MDTNSSVDTSTVLPTEVARPEGTAIALAVCLGLLSVFGAVGNCLTILVVVTDRKLRSHTANYLIVNLAVADLIVFIVIEPFLSLNATSITWPFSDSLCATLAVMVLKHLIVSDVMMATIAVNRYFSVVKHQSYHKMFTPRRTILLCIATWLPGLAVILAQVIPPYFVEFIPYYGICVIISWDTTFTKTLSIICGAVVILSIIISWCCYLQIYRTVKQSARRVRPNLSPGDSEIPPVSISLSVSRGGDQNHRAQNQASRADITLSLNLFIVFAVFCVCWAPLGILILVENSLGGITTAAGRLFPDWLWPTAYRMVLFNSTLNIFIYAWKNRNFRSAYAKVLRCRKCVRQSNTWQ